MVNFVENMIRNEYDAMIAEGYERGQAVAELAEQHDKTPDQIRDIVDAYAN